MKDPKQILDSWRTDIQSPNLYSDLLRQFDLEYPNRRGNRRKRKLAALRKTNHTAAALSLCLVTGLTMGVGSAFANNELEPDLNQPVDLPPSKAAIIQEPQGKEEKETGLERSIEEHRPQEIELPKAEEQPPAQPHEVKPNTPELPPSEEKPREVVADKEKPQPKQDSHQETDHHLPANGETSNSHHAPKKESPVAPEGQQSQELVRTGEEGVSLEAFSTERKEGNQTVYSKQSESQTQTGNDKRELPQTVEGGPLPHTAGNELNGVLLGSATALMGLLYTLRRGRGRHS